MTATAILALGCLYKLTFPNGKSYLGITKRTAAIRFAEHCKSAKLGRPLAVNRAITKYGPASVRVETLVMSNWAHLVELEPRAIASFCTMGADGYNMTQGGEGVVGLSPSEATRKKLRDANMGKKASEETKAKMRVASAAREIGDELRAKFRDANLGKVHSAESRARMSAAQKGKVVSAELLEKLRLASIGRVKTASERAKISAANKGRIMSAEHRANLSASAKGRVMSAESIAKQWATRAAKRLAQEIPCQ